MAKISYTTLKLKRNNEVKTFIYNNQEIEVLQYLPYDNKQSLINITMQRAQENKVYNKLALDMYFHLYIIMMYTNISFTDKQREDEIKLYDCLQSNGIIDEVLTNIPEAEYTYLQSVLEETVSAREQYWRSTGFALTDFLAQMPIDAENAADIVENFDPAQYQAVLDFAQAANGGRPIPSKE